MATKRKHPQARPLLELVQEVYDRTFRETVPADQQHFLTQMALRLLEGYAQTGERPLSGRNMNEVRGQYHVKRALQVAAAGGHNLLLIGPSGAGKTFLAQTLPSLLPTSATPYPFREPTFIPEISALIGEPANPGELTRAHGGVLLIKELDTLAAPLLAVLLSAIETHVVSLNYEKRSVLYPAKFILVATMKPCPCGFFLDRVRECRCSLEVTDQYWLHVKEFIQSCFGLVVEVPFPRQEDLLSTRLGESSADIRSCVEAAREIQRNRYAPSPSLVVNNDLRSIDDIQRYCQLDASAEKLLRLSQQLLHLTPLRMVQIQRIARTIADLATSPIIGVMHIAEAIQHRSRFTN